MEENNEEDIKMIFCLIFLYSLFIFIILISILMIIRLAQWLYISKYFSAMKLNLYFNTWFKVRHSIKLFFFTFSFEVIRDDFFPIIISIYNEINILRKTSFNFDMSVTKLIHNRNSNFILENNQYVYLFKKSYLWAPIHKESGSG